MDHSTVVEDRNLLNYLVGENRIKLRFMCLQCHGNCALLFRTGSQDSWLESHGNDSCDKDIFLSLRLLLTVQINEASHAPIQLRVLYTYQGELIEKAKLTKCTMSEVKKDGCDELLI